MKTTIQVLLVLGVIALSSTAVFAAPTAPTSTPTAPTPTAKVGAQGQVTIRCPETIADVSGLPALMIVPVNRPETWNVGQTSQMVLVSATIKESKITCAYGNGQPAVRTSKVIPAGHTCTVQADKTISCRY